jgi:hypothetical protein
MTTNWGGSYSVVLDATDSGRVYVSVGVRPIFVIADVGCVPRVRHGYVYFFIKSCGIYCSPACGTVGGRVAGMTLLSCRPAMGVSVANVDVVLGIGVEVGGAVISACRSGVCEAEVLGVFAMRSLLICK